MPRSKLQSVISIFESAERVEVCLAGLAETRALTNHAIVGFKEGHHSPAVARIPRPQYWARQFGWPNNFMRQWLRLNLSRASVMPEISRTSAGLVTNWLVSATTGVADADGEQAVRLESAKLLRSIGIESGTTATVRRPTGSLAQVSWLKPDENKTALGGLTESDLVALTQSFFDALDRVRSSSLETDLTPREIECLLWAAYGCSDKEIGHEIGCSHDTVRFHMKNIVRKLGASNRTHAVAIGMQQGLISLRGAAPRIN